MDGVWGSHHVYTQPAPYTFCSQKRWIHWPWIWKLVIFGGEGRPSVHPAKVMHACCTYHPQSPLFLWLCFTTPLQLSFRDANMTKTPSLLVFGLILLGLIFGVSVNSLPPPQLIFLKVLKAKHIPHKNPVVFFHQHHQKCLEFLDQTTIQLRTGLER